MPRQRAHRSTISLPPKLRSRLEARGARSDKSHGPYNYTRQLARALELYDSVLVKSDPRQTRDMSEDDYETVVAVLLDPLALESFHIVRLGDFLFDLPDFRARARERGIDPQRFRDQLNAFAYAEKLHLVDAAQVRNAPPLAAAPAGEPRARRKAR
ncbi:MAG: hypothetical protein JOZ15_14860 [Acidobacteria bacterium]|nr:hypothetical protein [Acidobacteriota bacterium]